MKSSFLIVLVVALILVVILGSVLTLVGLSAVSMSQKNFSFIESLPQSINGSGSLLVSDVNGGIKLIPWSQNVVLINGTITARGLGANPDAINLIQSDINGSITFVAKFPNASDLSIFAARYSANIFVFLPSSFHFSTAQIETVNGGLEIGNLVATNSISLITINGAVDFGNLWSNTVSISSVNGGVAGNLSLVSPTGSYTITTVNGGITAGVPVGSSFKLTASTVNGGIQTNGLSMTSVSELGNNRITANVGSVNATAFMSLATVSGGVSISAY